MAFEIPRAPSAFALSPGGRKKRPRIHDNQHLNFIRGLGCAVCGRRPVEAAHVRMPSEADGKRGVGTGEKPSDKWVVPQCPEHHRDQHAENEAGWWLRQGIDPIRLCLALWASTGDDEAAETILARARDRGGR